MCKLYLPLRLYPDQASFNFFVRGQHYTNNDSLTYVNLVGVRFARPATIQME
jgi:hypothetical protein